MILYYFSIAQNTVNKTFYRGVNACICLCTYFTIFAWANWAHAERVIGQIETIVDSPEQRLRDAYIILLLV